MNFGPNDTGPFWMTLEEQQNTKNDITDHMIQKKESVHKEGAATKANQKKYKCQRNPCCSVFRLPAKIMEYQQKK